MAAKSYSGGWWSLLVGLHLTSRTQRHAEHAIRRTCRTAAQLETSQIPDSTNFVETKNAIQVSFAEYHSAAQCSRFQTLTGGRTTWIMSKHSQPSRKPSFSELPLLEDGPRGNAWGLFGKKDDLGLLTYITPEVTHAATKEILYGMRIPTDLPLDFFKNPAFGRDPFRREIENINGWAVNDDVVMMNTQSSSQWDGFRHFGMCKFQAPIGSLCFANV